MTKQTAVDFLIEKFSKHYAIHQLTDEIEEAKEMEKKQITESYRSGVQDERYDQLKLHGEYYKQLYEKH